MRLWELDVMVRGVCPINGLNSDGVIFFCDEATDDARAAAQWAVDENLSSVDTTFGS